MSVVNGRKMSPSNGQIHAPPKGARNHMGRASHISRTANRGNAPAKIAKRQPMALKGRGNRAHPMLRSDSIDKIGPGLHFLSSNLARRHKIRSCLPCPEADSLLRHPRAPVSSQPCSSHACGEITPITWCASGAVAGIIPPEERLNADGCLECCLDRVCPSGGRSGVIWRDTDFGDSGSRSLAAPLHSSAQVWAAFWCSCGYCPGGTAAVLRGRECIRGC